MMNDDEINNGMMKMVNGEESNANATTRKFEKVVDRDHISSAPVRALVQTHTHIYAQFLG